MVNVRELEVSDCIVGGCTEFEVECKSGFFADACAEFDVECESQYLSVPHRVLQDYTMILLILSSRIKILSSPQDS